MVVQQRSKVRALLLPLVKQPAERYSVLCVHRPHGP